MSVVAARASLSTHTPDQLDHIDLDTIPGFFGVGLDQPDPDLIRLKLACGQLIWILPESNVSNVAGVTNTFL